ncbi:MAG: ATP-binding protein [Myxococcales bacterium]|nr:ATP-binding protein [Myxococcales bacterium]
MKLVPRRAGAVLRRMLGRSPAVLVYGPRQCGKTTLVRSVLPDWHHVDLERPRDIALVRADLEGWLEGHAARVAIDEAQRLPELFPALRHALDARPTRGRVVLLGSASPTLMRTAAESLAGRLALLELTPLLAAELAGTRAERDRWFWGGFPRVHALASARARVEWLDDYLGAVLERDLPALGIGLPPTRLRTLVEMLVHVHGNLLNASDLARSLGVSVPTVSRDLDVLEGLFVTRRLQPFHANIQKRLTKSPKIYLRDTGLLHVLGGLRAPRDLETWSRRGASFEGMVVEEVTALARERCVRPGVFFWRTEAGGEVDLVVTDGTRVVPIEIKLGSAVDHHALRGLRQCMADLGVARGYVVVGSGERTRIGSDIELVPWSDVVLRRASFGLGARR